MDKSQISTFIPKEDIYINEPMSKHTTFKIGGPADVFVKVRTVEQIKKIVEFANLNGQPIQILGNGSNVLVKDKGIRGITVKICLDSYEFIDEEKARVQAGILNAKLARVLLEHSLSGFEFASGIPGTVGGAIRMNAGAYGSQMSDIVESVRYMDLEDNMQIKELDAPKCKFDYRHSIFFEKKAVIIDAVIKLKKSDKAEIQRQMEQNNNLRKEKQPTDKPNAGSTFKRGQDFLTAKLIDECGLKGFTIGGAQVSEKHAGFIVNAKNATADDVINLINAVKEKVWEKFQKKIELEIEIIGE